MTPPNSSANQEAETAAFRTRLRQAKIAARMAMTADEHAHASAIIENRLEALLADRPPQAIAFCWPLRGEFDCRPLITRLLAKGWRAVQPVAVAPGQAMVFRLWTPETPMTQDRHGIPIPEGGAVSAPDIVLLPLVAFDPQGYRLGYGGGYFDRTLAALSPRPVTIGVGFDLACVASTRPQAHDIRLDIIVTEAASMMMS
ncbi:MAG: 5-formyltetrahydrofolate cyclo-ligase [Zoogloeaceae bacterium]|jgi:5,10-methenyltetrahydrofolate synthetase|nr:5-formyltetrahydrofolate cyclo-ligase [Zoogloeaceae bacterium]